MHTWLIIQYIYIYILHRGSCMCIGKKYFETGSQVVQAGPKLTMSLRIDFNLLPSNS